MITGKEALINALISGKYKRRRFHLRVGNTFCPMGMACDLFRQVTGRGKWVKGSDMYAFWLDGDRYYSSAPNAVLFWLGIDQIDAETIMELNDGRKYSKYPYRNPVRPVTTRTIVKFLREYV